MRSFSHLISTNPGFRTDHLIKIEVSLPAQAYPKAAEMRAFYDRLARSLPVLPGIKASGLGTSLPLGINERRSFFIDSEGRGERLIHRIDPSLPVTKVETMEAELEDSVRAQRFQTTLLGGFAAAALILAALGIGGVLAYSVAQRVSEIGIRMALGADRTRVVGMVVGRGMKLAAGGTIIGMTAALPLMRLLWHLLYETSPYDAFTFCAAPMLLCSVGLLAILFPARRAASVDPIESLRAE